MGNGVSSGGTTRVEPVGWSPEDRDKARVERQMLEEQRKQFLEEKRLFDEQRRQTERDRDEFNRHRSDYESSQKTSSSQVSAPVSAPSGAAEAAKEVAGGAQIRPQTRQQVEQDARSKEDARTAERVLMAAARKEYEDKRTAEESRHCVVTKNADGSSSVEAKWVGYFTGGYESIRNPQFSLALPKGGVTTLTLERLETTRHEASGLCLFVYRNRDGCRALEFLTGNVVAKSKFLKGEKVVIETVKLPATAAGSNSLVLIPTQEFKGDAGRFRITVLNEHKDQDLRLIPSNKVVTFKSKWSFASKKCGGLKSPANPQFQVIVHRPVNCSITVMRPDNPSKDDGTCFFLCKGVPGKPNRPKRQLADPDVLHKSEFLITSELSTVCRLDHEIGVPFIIVVSRGLSGSAGEGPFTLAVESDDYAMEAVELNEDPPKYKEDSCDDIIARHTAQGKIGLLSSNPLDEIVARLESTGSVYIDSSFPPNNASLNDQPNLPNALAGIDEWRRLDNLCDNPELFLDGIEPDDMQQGDLGDCWFCQAVAAIAQQSPSKIEELFMQKNYSKYGVYCLRLFVDQQWYYIVIDDYIPCANNRPAFAHSKSPNETWVGLLEKALAKCHGSYQALIGTGGRNLGAANALSVLTGGDSKIIEIKPGDMDEKLWSGIVEYNLKHWFMGCGSRGAASLGIISTHGYSILDAVEAEGLKLLKLRNTWGRTEWLGDWGDDSKLWSAEMKEALRYQNADDGIFWMNFYDFTMHFDHIYMCRMTGDVLKFITHLKGEWRARSCGGVKSHQNPQYSVLFDAQTPPRPTNLLIKLRRDHKFDAEGMVILVYRNEGPDPRKYGLMEKERDAELVAQSPFKDTKELSYECELPPSEKPYTIVLCLEHPDVQDSFRFNLYSDAPHHVNQLRVPAKHSSVGMWRGESAAGFRSFLNPKYLLFLSARSRCFLSATRQCKGEPDGFALFVVKGSLNFERTEDGWVPDDAVVARSAFLKANAVSLDCFLEGGYYLVFPCRKLSGAEGEGVFTLTLECDDDSSKLDQYHGGVE